MFCDETEEGDFYRIYGCISEAVPFSKDGKASQTCSFPVGRNTLHIECILFSLPLVLNPLYIQYMILHLFLLLYKAYLQVCVSGGKGTLFYYSFSSHKSSFFWLWI